MMFREIARKKQSLEMSQMIQILNSEKRGVLSVHGDNGYPYGLPINYWYNEENGCLYFHSGKKGHKIDAISSNDKVSFCIYDEGVKKDGEWALNISSVIIFGKMRIVDDEEKAIEILLFLVNSIQSLLNSVALVITSCVVLEVLFLNISCVFS